MDVLNSKRINIICLVVHLPDRFSVFSIVIIACFGLLGIRPEIYSQVPVDLGLSVRWANCNLGAEKPEDYGGLYGWADPTGECTDANVYDDDWNWLPDSLYGGYMPTMDISGTQLDIVRAKWGKPWRLPKCDEMKELITRCRKEKAVINGIEGIRFIGPSGNSIFLPSSGYRVGNDTLACNVSGFYWTGSIGRKYKDKRDSRPWTLFFKTRGFYYECSDYSQRQCGYSIRPVRK